MFVLLPPRLDSLQLLRPALSPPRPAPQQVPRLGLSSDPHALVLVAARVIVVAQRLEFIPGASTLGHEARVPFGSFLALYELGHAGEIFGGKDARGGDVASYGVAFFRREFSQGGCGFSLARADGNECGALFVVDFRSGFEGYILLLHLLVRFFFLFFFFLLHICPAFFIVFSVCLPFYLLPLIFLSIIIVIVLTIFCRHLFFSFRTPRANRYLSLQ
mmetsp:Transcript_33175/g.76538  ORF Transcript_33175/g.76538 Transcript_33175/m.76538 type:complete len:217 (-) Transcript_33175:1200-1850(-)